MSQPPLPGLNIELGWKGKEAFGSRIRRRSTLSMDGSRLCRVDPFQTFLTTLCGCDTSDPIFDEIRFDLRELWSLKELRKQPSLEQNSIIYRYFTAIYLNLWINKAILRARALRALDLFLDKYRRIFPVLHSNLPFSHRLEVES